MKLVFDDPEFDSQVQRTVAKAPYRFCDFGEVFAIADRIEEGNLDSWYDEWFAAGDAALALADAAATAGHRETAGDAFVRASEYYRSAYFFCRRDPQGAPLLAAFRASRDAYRRAIPFLPVAIDTVEIPYEDGPIPGYVLWADGDRAGPTVLMPSGYDQPVEETHSLGALEAVRRGMNVVMFGGPGQAEMLYEQGIPFRHDFEAVVTPVVDWVERHDTLRSDRIAMIGRSFAGYLAPRAASAEHRIGVLTADPPQTDMYENVRSRLPADWMALLEADDPDFDDRFWSANQGVQKEEFWMSRARSHGCETPRAYFRELRQWVVPVEQIRCATFVSYGEGDFAQTTADEFYERLTAPKAFEMFKEADGSGGHCEGMGVTRYYASTFGFISDKL